MKQLLLFFMSTILLAHCTKKPETPKAILDLIKKYNSTKEEVAKYDALIKKAGSDEGAIIQLNYDKELAKSRFERTKEQLKQTSPEKFKEVEGAGAEGGGGGHH